MGKPTVKPIAFVASEDAKIRELVRSALVPEKVEPILCGNGVEVLESAKEKTPEGSELKLVILEAFLPKMDGFEVVNRLQDVPQVRDVPVLMLLNKGVPPRSLPSSVRLKADNYLQKPFELKEIQAEIHSMVKYFRKHAAPHPVTHLPGHPQMEQEIVQRLSRGQVLSTLWMDINHFRPFNDHLGTEKGNQVLLATVKLIQDVIKSLPAAAGQEPFLAHVDGDDFILLLSEPLTTQIKATLRERFSQEIQNFYAASEIEKGFIYEKGRDKKDQIFPLMGLSMVDLKVSVEKFQHYGLLVSESSELLRQTKVGAQDVK
ncbi:MAG: diguanylate cyclase [Elusimicrobia bacterium]|nr:diguanylate cyclase [Elusimicrobiota bacterium]